MKKNILTLAIILVSVSFSFSQNHNYDNHWGGLYAAPSTRYVGVGHYYVNQTDPNNTKIPEHQLEISSWSTNTVLGNNTKSALRINNNTWSFNALSEIQFGIDNDPKHLLSSISSLYKSYGSSAGGELIFSTSSPGTVGVTERLRITDDGNIGIGTTNPTVRLTVNGKILCEEVKVILDVPSSDYVFEKDYNLMPLKEVQSFIQKNKHLPEVPSAQEFKENGYKVGEMDDLLLRKVEELTLYIIDLKEEINELNSEVEHLQENK